MANPSPEIHDHFEQSLTIAAPAHAVFASFFAPPALRAWWQTVRSYTTPVPIGVYAVEWQPTPYRDDLLGPLGGTFHGTIVDVRRPTYFMVADCWWIPPEGEPLGPMALHVTCEIAGQSCRLTVRQEGCEPHRAGGGTTRSSRATGRSL